ncbi:MAG: hypothetical protein NTZ24_13035 [Deltaproteobacteria bacterium]|nr:hypothetical protein [Deltaproteobacteria bacterium]
MFRKKRLFILIPTLLLIPLLFGMTPLWLVNKLSHGGHFTQSQSKQGCVHKNCFSHSLISQNHFDTVIIDAISPDQRISYSLKIFNAGPESFYSNIPFTSMPLRC